MSIQNIKSNLPISQVLNYYGLSANKNKMLNCPFHEDKTPSMQMYPDSDTVYCFSSNCELEGRSIDVIDFIMHKEGTTKHEAINKAKELAGIIAPDETIDYEKQFTLLRKALLRSSKAKNYLKERHLSDLSEIGYNNRTLKELRDCLIFPLKDKSGKIVSLYGRSLNERIGRHYYTIKRKGLYPKYPSRDIETLILTESIIDAQTIIDHYIKSPDSIKNVAVLALYGTNGLRQEHKTAIKSIKNLKEIIFFLDGDESGKKSTEKYSKELHSLFPDLIISKVITPEGEDPNSLVQSHDSKILAHLIETRIIIYTGITPKVESPNKDSSNHIKLDTKTPEYLHYHDKNVIITIMGGIHLYPVDRLKVTLKLEKVDSHNPLHKLRHTLDLYNDDSFEKLIKKSSEKLDLSTKELQITLTNLIEELEQYREEQIEKQKPKTPEKRQLTEKRRQKAIDFLSEPDLLKRTNDLIGQSGVVGEETNRLLMYLIFTSRLREHPLHIISLGASGTGKTYLQEKISQLIPEEHKLEITTLSENALYYFGIAT